MHDEVIRFLDFLEEVPGTIMRLRMITLRVDTTKIFFINTIYPERRKEYREQLQQYFDLFAHVYKGKPVRDFGSIKVIDNIR